MEVQDIKNQLPIQTVLTHYNLISDSQKGIDQIKYTYHDLPLSINTDQGDIKNWYTADGLKIKAMF